MMLNIQDVGFGLEPKQKVVAGADAITEARAILSFRRRHWFQKPGGRTGSLIRSGMGQYPKGCRFNIPATIHGVAIQITSDLERPRVTQLRWSGRAECPQVLNMGERGSALKRFSKFIPFARQASHTPQLLANLGSAKGTPGTSIGEGGE
jgi:hypothetical protein